MIIYQISAFIENKPGKLEGIIKTLADENISIRALSIADTTDFGILRLIVNDTDAAIKALERKGVTASKTQVIGVRMSDDPGALYNVLRVLKSADVAVEYAYAFITHSKNEACVVLRVEDNERAAEVLTAGGIRLVSEIE